MNRPVVVCNAFSDDNKGGSAITQQTIDWVKRHFPGNPVFLVPVVQSGGYEEHQHRFTLRRHPDATVVQSPIRAGHSSWATAQALARSLALLWRRPGGDAFERTLAGADVVVSKGGYVFVERESSAGLLSLWFTAFPLVYAARKGVRTVVLCTTVGPFRRRGSRLLARWILRRVDLVVTRDPLSTEQARDLGCARVLECPDIALTFAPNGAGGSGQPLPAGRFACLVVSAERRKPDERFLRRLGELSRRMLDERVVERALVVVQSEEDRALSARFVERCGDPRITLLGGDLAPEELVEVYGAAELVITKRLHAGLFAMLAGTPVLMFSTDGVKSDGILEQLEMSDRLLPYPDFSLDEAWRRIQEIRHDGVREVERIRRTIGRGRREAEAALDRVAVALQGVEAGGLDAGVPIA